MNVIELAELWRYLVTFTAKNDMRIDTPRLTIIPLTYNQLQLYLKADGLLETELGLELKPRIISLELAEAFEQDILPLVASSDNYLFSTLWTIVLKELNVMVGDLCFKGKPNDMGEVEIGYGIYVQFRGKGYMSEAISAITQWVFEQDGVGAVIAETDSENISSHRVLEKCGFAQYNASSGMLWWRLECPK